jgi:antirestriction protein ArdC
MQERYVPAVTTAQGMAMLSEGLKALVSADKWRSYLDTQARFHHYSFANVMMILAQQPEATKVAGFRTWLTFGRNVKRGETGIRIWCPITFKDKLDPETKRLGFRLVSVFDIAQTEGKELSHFELPEIVGGDMGVTVYLSNFVQEQGWEIGTFPGTENGPKGVCYPKKKRIELKASLSGGERASVLAHELGHMLLHKEVTIDYDTRCLGEFEAESVSYIVCKALGLPADEQSFIYCATWVGQKDIDALVRASGNAIQKAAATLIDYCIKQSQVEEEMAA